METASAGNKAKVYECFLQGALPADNYDLFVERLNSLSDTEVGEVHFRETVFKAISPTNTQAPPSIAGPQKNELRVRCNSDQPKNWSLHYIGVPLNRDKMTVNIRNVISVDVSDNIMQFLVLMGYQYQYEFLRDGISFTNLKKKITTTITKIKKVVDKEDLNSAEELDACWLVEVSALTNDEGINETTEELTTFGSFLLPLVEVKRIDFRKYTNAELKDAKKDGDPKQDATKKRTAPPSPQRPPTMSQPPPPLIAPTNMLVPPPPTTQPPPHTVAAARIAMTPQSQPPQQPPPSAAGGQGSGGAGPAAKKAKTEGWITVT